ncbi:MAG: DUF2753 family protein [Cellvibrio sp.]
MTSVALMLEHQQPVSLHTLALESWKLEICAANNAFIHGQHRRAFDHYQAALELASSGIKGLMQAEDVSLLVEAERQIAALVVTQHNLADLFRQAGQLAITVEHLCSAHETLFQLLHHSNEDVRTLAHRHSNVTYQELMSFIQRHGQHPRIKQTLLLTKYVCECCRQKVAH